MSGNEFEFALLHAVAGPHVSEIWKVVVNVIFDDASTWISPNYGEDSRGKTVKRQCVTSLAMVQDMYRRLPGAQYIGRVQVHSPGQTVTKANWVGIQGRGCR